MKHLIKSACLALVLLLVLQSVLWLPVYADEPEQPDPVSPAEPTEPTEATEPTEPTEPTDEPEPTQPVTPPDPMERFQLADDAVICTFTDVGEDAWYHSFVAYGQSLGIIAGKTETTFAPDDKMTVAEALTLAVRVYEIYHDLTASHEAQPGEPWFNPYVQAAREYDILPEGDFSFSEPVKRDLAAAIYARMLPGEELAPINRVNRLPDADGSDPYFEYILTLYRAGVMQGKDELGTFDPQGTATRAELVKILCAVVNPKLRAKFHLMLGDLSAFVSQYTLEPACPFTDVSKGSWYYPFVAIQSELGIVNGVGNNRYEPDGTVTYAQALKVAVEVYEKYYDMEPGEIQGDWRDYYAQKALDYGILVNPREDYNEPAIRGDVILFLYRAIEKKDLAQMNVVNAIPDVGEDSFYYDAAMTLYRAGVLQGSDAAGTANLYENITRAELATLLTRLVLPEQRVQFTLDTRVIKSFEYGTSGSGRYALEGYQIGDGKNVMVLTFAIHGWEDNWARDGAELVTLADRTKAYLEANYALVENGNWTVYILRCLNPDGLYLGTTCNGPGRCTTTYYNANGSLITGSGKGIDMNRCFPYNYKTRTDARNYNGTAPLQAKEARALASFMQKAKGSGKNICIDTHGWFSQIITSSGKGTIYKALLKQFPDNTYASLSGGSGYFSSWCAYELGYDSCLLELPSSVTSHARFESLDCTGRYTSAIADLLQNYQNRGATREAFIPPLEELNGN